MTNEAPVLLVDNDPDDVDLTLRALSRADIANEVIVARNGVEALARLLPDNGAPALEPAVVLLDLKLPLLDGLEVLRRLRGDPRTRTLPVVVLSGSDHEQDRIDSYSLGANGFVTKPVHFAEFMEVARLLALCWLVLNQPPPAPR